jgi:shikimate kinase
MKGITLIGMPGSGKSAIGKRVAPRLGFKFIDLDELILQTQGIYHHDYMMQKGEPALVELENNLTLGLNLEDTIFSPGGSIIYSKNAMDKLKKETLLVYLSVSLEQVKKHLGDKINRNGIIGLAAKGIEGLYKERTPLYEKFADIIIDCIGSNLEEKVEQVHQILKKQFNAFSQH